MATIPEPRPDGAIAENRGPERVAAAIARAVLRALGQPADFLKATVRQVHGGNYRVNVVTGANAASARIAHSFFVTADEQGNVTASAPAIARQY